MSRSLFVVISIIAISTFLGFSFWTVGSIFDDNTRIHLENGLIENIQACLLAISCIVYLIGAFFAKKPEKLILCTCSLLCYSFLLREVQVGKLDIPNVLKIIGSGIGRNLTIGTAFVAIFAYAIFSDYSYYKTAALGFIRTRPGVLLLAAALFLVLGFFFEEQKLMIHHQFYEEISELFGYLLILLSSFATVPFVNNTTISFNYRDKTNR